MPVDLFLVENALRVNFRVEPHNIFAVMWEPVPASSERIVQIVLHRLVKFFRSVEFGKPLSPLCGFLLEEPQFVFGQALFFS
jgi:hypothetical protein